MRSAHRVVAAGMPGAAPRDAAHAQPAAPEQPVALDGLLGVPRAAGLEAARRWQPCEQHPIEMDEPDADPLHPLSDPRAVLVSSNRTRPSRNSAYPAPALAGRQMTRMSQPPPSGWVQARRISRTRRRTRFRTTADPIVRPVEMANRSRDRPLARLRTEHHRWCRVRPPRWRASRSRFVRSISNRRPGATASRAPSGGELPPALGTPGREHASTTLGLHACAEPVLLGTMSLLGLIRLLRHGWA